MVKKAKPQDEPLPSQVADVLKTNRIGYLSVISKSGELYSYPIAYYYSKPAIHFVTPVSAAKYKILKNNPKVSFIVDNAKVTTEACGAMLQGRARIFTIGRTILNILTLGPKIAGFSRKYPGMLSFYAKGKELPDERKLYNYRLIRITPSKIVYWTGYSFGRWTRKDDDSDIALDLPDDESGMVTVASLFQPAEANIRESNVHDWLTTLDNLPSHILTAEEDRFLREYQKSEDSNDSRRSAGVTTAERMMLKRSSLNRKSGSE